MSLVAQDVVSKPTYISGDFGMRELKVGKEEAMRSNPAATVAFRHLVEDGLSILAAKPIEPARRQYVLEGLRDLIEQASKGSELVRQRSLVVSSDDRSAYESFSFIERHLSHHYDDKLIQGARDAFKRLSQNADLTPDTRDAASVVLEKLLSSISREGNTGIPHEPEEIKLPE